MLTRNFIGICRVNRLVVVSRLSRELRLDKTKLFLPVSILPAGNFKGAIQLSRSFSTHDSVAQYAEIKDLPNHPEKLLIDVREPDELVKFGKIPTSINIPLNTVQETLTSKLAKETFKKKFGRNFPEVNDEIIFMCQKGMRSQKGLEIAIAAGYKNVRNYRGSWIDWAEREGIPIPSS